MVPFGSFRHSDMEDKHAEAAEQENRATKPPRGWSERGDDTGKRDDRDDRKRKCAILNEQSDKFARRHGPVYHHGLSLRDCYGAPAAALRLLSKVTKASPVPRNSAINARIARSAPGQSMPNLRSRTGRKAESITPTANFNAFSEIGR